jgi:hypothetical protein
MVINLQTHKPKHKHNLISSGSNYSNFEVTLMISLLYKKTSLVRRRLVNTMSKKAKSKVGKKEQGAPPKVCNVFYGRDYYCLIFSKKKGPYV